MSINKSSDIIAHRHHIFTFLGRWMLLGIAMMVLSRTVWPELGVTELKWFYQVATLWVTLLDKIFELGIPVLSMASKVLLEFIFNTIEFAKAYGPILLGFGAKILQDALRFSKNLVVLCGIMIILYLVGWGILYAINKPLAEHLFEDFKEDIAKWWKSLQRQNGENEEEIEDINLFAEDEHESPVNDGISVED